jgi:hypothetical protein
MNNEGELVVNSSRHRTQKCALCTRSALDRAGRASAALCVLTVWRTLSTHAVAAAGRTMRTRLKSCR